MQQATRVKTAKNIAVIALISALYAVLGTLSGLLVGPALRGYPAHFFRGLTMSVAAAYSGRMWSTTLMGLISGLVFLALVPAPAPYLLASTLAAGLVYDLVVAAGGSYQVSSRRRGRILSAVSLSGLAESLVALAILTYLGFFQVPASVLAMIWVGAIAANLVLSVAGSSITILILNRYA
jgi:LytS/YehU family sensor histidine kinase